MFVLQFRRVFVLFLISVVIIRVNALRLPQVTVQKCCRVGESLQGDVTSMMCVPGAGDKWLPSVYAPRKMLYLTKDTIPPNWNVQEAELPAGCAPGTALTMIKTDGTGANYVMFVNGSLYVNEFRKLYHPGQFCIDKSVALVCTEEQEEEHHGDDVQVEHMKMSPKRRLKIKKCCGEDGAYSEDTNSCVSAPTLRSYGPLIPDELIDENTTTYIVQGFPVCNSGSGFVIAAKFYDSILQTNGSLSITTSSELFSPDQYCLEYVYGQERPSANIFMCPESVREDPSVSEWDFRFTFYPLGLFISALFLAATLATGFLLPASHHVLHWRCQTNYVACLFVGDLLLAFTQFAGHSIRGPTCVTVAILMHFFFLSAFFWLNTMCFNIWWTFRDFRPTSLEKSQEVCRLRVYQIYAWGGPLVIAGVAALLDNLPNSPSDAFLRPRFGQQSCWFFGDMEILTYFFGPVGLLLAVNLLLFASTARQLTCGLWKRDEVKSTTERAALGRVCMKLVVVMGITWVADVVSWAVGGPHYLWYVTDLVNALQGVFIFVVVGCQPQVWAAIKKFWSERAGHTAAANGAPQNSSSSQGLPSMGDSVTNNTNTVNNTTVKMPLETVC